MAKAKQITVSEYINQASPEVRKKLKEMRAILKEVTPGAEENIKWSIPQKIICTSF